MLLLLSADIFQNQIFQRMFRNTINRVVTSREKSLKNAKKIKVREKSGKFRKKSGIFYPKKLIVTVNVLKFLIP